MLCRLSIILAYLIHPVYKGENLTTEQVEIVCNKANMKIPYFLELKKAFQAEETPFVASYFKTTVAYVWWKGVTKM